ncbi:MAG: PBP1A family penicillin-binding protein [Gemmatimonadaceae bacterium]|nr:PBP1A family penicillin-binding protein [Gemmatimonadaceae bacterium]
MKPAPEAEPPAAPKVAPVTPSFVARTIARWSTGRRAKLLRVARRAAPTLAVLTGLAGLTGGSWWYSCGWHGCPSVAQLKAWKPSEGGALLGRDSGFVSALTSVKRHNVTLARVPEHVQQAFIAVEDRRFHNHGGIDWRGVARAFVANIRAGGVREGASTITMQLARNVFLGTRAAERTWGRKALEVRYAGLLERALSKDEILERYLNAIYLGNGVYGVEAASRDLFSKGVKDLTLGEAALLAGLPKAPSTYSPRNSRARALARRDVVFDVLRETGVATPAEIARARRAPLKFASREFTPTRTVDSWAVEAARTTIDSLRRLGVLPPGIRDAELRVWTTIDRRAQIAAERAVAAQAARIDEERAWNGGAIRGNNRTQGALVALDPVSGAVRAIVGGRRIERKGFNRALKSKRQPGSTFKPFVYAVALQNGFTTATLVDDEPVTVDAGRDVWRPANYGDDYAGRITLRDALTRSANAATVRVSRDVGVQRIAGLAQSQGISSNLPLVPALALGAASVTPLELTASYAPFANGGERVIPTLITRIENPFGDVLWQAPPVQRTRVLPAEDAFLVTSMLQSVVDRGTGYSVREAGIRGPVAGKTGTTNDGTDVWFVGYTPSLVASVWFGADVPQPLGWNASGGRMAAPAWARFLRESGFSPEREAPWTPPAGIESRQIDITTGALASDWCGPSRREYFKRGTAPTRSCEQSDYVAMRDDDPPDWHESDREGQRGASSAHEALNDALENLLESTQAGDRARAIARNVMREIQRAAERDREAQREAQREARRRNR